MATEIRRDFPDDLHLVAVLTGAFVFLADLMRDLDGPVSIDFIGVSSYGTATASSGRVSLVKDLDVDPAGRNVVLVEDIVDTGVTLAYLQQHLRSRAPRALATASLLSKPARRRTDVTIDYVGFTIDDAFVVGYGLDYAGQYRNLPYIAIAAEEIV